MLCSIYKDLYDCCQVPGLNNAFYTETNDAMIGGQAAMIMNYFAFLPALANTGTNPYADVTGFFANPAGPTGNRASCSRWSGRKCHLLCQPGTPAGVS